MEDILKEHLVLERNFKLPNSFSWERIVQQ